MATLTRLVQDRTDLADEDIDLLTRIAEEWSLIADLSLSDLVLWVPTWNDGGLVAVAQVRPTTAPTVAPTTWTSGIGVNVAASTNRSRPVADSNTILANNAVIASASHEAVCHRRVATASRSVATTTAANSAESMPLKPR